jgi:hypothetical protein
MIFSERSNIVSLMQTPTLSSFQGDDSGFKAGNEFAIGGFVKWLCQHCGKCSSHKLATDRPPAALAERVARRGNYR